RKNEIPPKLSTTKSFEELKALQKLDREFADQIHGLQQKQKALALSTNSRSIVDNRVVLFQSVIERKLSLLKEKYTLESNPERTEKEEKQLASINKQLEKVPAEKRKTLEQKRDKLLKKIKSKKDPKKEIESLEKILPKLAQPPTKETIDTLKKEIELELDSLPKNLSVTDARLQYLGTPYLNLRWGEKFVNIALTNPANWLTKYEVGIRFSRNGKAHVQVTKVEPQNIHKEGGVPARLRNDPGYNTRPANVNKTTSYILSDRDTHGKEHVSFRIGQFPTMKAAKEALKTMMRENPGKLTDYHDNTLLTPTMFPDRPDRKLIRQHHENVKAALASLLQDVKTTSALKDSIDTLSILESIDTDVRKEDLQQHKDLFSDDPEIRDAVTVDTLRSILEKRLQEKQVLDGKGNPYTEKDVQQIIDKCTMSYFGVNEGAVGKMHGLRLGWHTSMGEYNNEATRKLSRVLKEKLTTIESKVQTGEALTEEEKGILDRLGGIVQVGQEFEAVWAKNDYMNADVGNNQVKAPALWRALDSLLNITVNTHCMSVLGP
ncbi:MAG: hypothetical protein ACE5GN_07670, partial [Waddliaceae bacterium]